MLSSYFKALNGSMINSFMNLSVKFTMTEFRTTKRFQTQIKMFVFFRNWFCKYQYIIHVQLRHATTQRLDSFQGTLRTCQFNGVRVNVVMCLSSMSQRYAEFPHKIGNVLYDVTTLLSDFGATIHSLAYVQIHPCDPNREQKRTGALFQTPSLNL